jgi:hypothetical protein
VYDETDGLFVTDAMYVFSTKVDFDPWTVLAVLQSKLFLFLYRVANQGESRVIPQVKAAKLGTLPLPNFNDQKVISDELSTAAKNMCALNGQLGSEKSESARNELLRRLSRTDREIDGLVYELYGLGERERQLVDEAGVIVAEGSEVEVEEVSTV